jgi:hypothetical protein
VREAESGAQAWAEAEALAPEAVVVDSWLPDLELAEFLRDFRKYFPDVDLLTTGAASSQESPRGPYRQELLYALRRSQDTDTAALNTAPAMGETGPAPERTHAEVRPFPVSARGASVSLDVTRATIAAEIDLPTVSRARVAGPSMSHPRMVCERLPELVGNAPCMLEVSRRVRLRF